MFIRSFGVALVLLVSSAAAVPIIVVGDTADYHITLPEGNSPINTLQGLGSTQLGTFRETRNPPVGRTEAERRAIFQFDLGALAGMGNTITSASFSVFLPSQASGIPTHDLDLWGSSQNRTGVVNYTDAAAANEYDAASYGLVVSALIPRPTPPDLNQRYSGDITTFLQSRLDAYLLDNTQRYVFFRTQVEPNLGTVNSFYVLNSAEAGTGFEPQLDVTIVPSPAPWALVLMMGGAALRRRR